MNRSSFVDAHGATVEVPADLVLDYVGVKSEQLTALTQFLTNVQVGAIELDEKDRQIFQLMANEYARTVDSLVSIAANAAKKGGVQ